jgi:hypothetical protein
MDEIERSVVLPKGANSLAAYGRNYAFADRGRVVASYLVPLPLPNFDDGCEEMLENFSSRPCTQEEVAEGAASNARAAAARTAAGKRRWLRKPMDLPHIGDGGCMEVRVEFDTAAHRVLSVACNGRL